MLDSADRRSYRSDPLTVTHGSSSSAVKRGRELAIAAKTEHVIHKMDGTIAERNSYGNDPPSRPG